MSTYLPKDILAGLAEAKTATLRKKSRMWVEFDGNMYPVLRIWERGFAMDANAAPALRGFVDVFEGGEPAQRGGRICIHRKPTFPHTQNWVHISVKFDPNTGLFTQCRSFRFR